MTKEIPLTQGKVALVDDEDYERVSQFKWYANRGHGTFYARRMVGKEPHRAVQHMHRLVIGAVPDDGQQVDHINGNGLDNRRENLRLCSQAENIHNRTKYKCNTSGYKGVSYNQRDRKWQAQIKLNSKRVSLGYFPDPVSAAHAYDAAARKLHGAFARTNFKVTDESR